MIADAEIKKRVETEVETGTKSHKTRTTIEEDISALYSSGVVGKYIARNFPVLSQEDVEDIINDAFKYVLENAEKLRERDKLKAWVFKIASSFACIHRNKTTRSCINFYGENFDELLDKVCYSEDNVTETQEQKELRRFMRELISILPPVCRSIMELRYREDLLFNEIALKMDMNYNTVRSMHARCIKLLRNLLEERGVTINDFYE